MLHPCTTCTANLPTLVLYIYTRLVYVLVPKRRSDVKVVACKTVYTWEPSSRQVYIAVELLVKFDKSIHFLTGKK